MTRWPGGNRDGMRVIEEGRLPVHTWAPDLEEGACRQAVNCANLPVAHHHVAVMADGHQGYGVPIGAVVALAGAISPYAVGNDIGCGMALVPTSLTRDDVLAPLSSGSGGRGPRVRDEIMGGLQAVVPSGTASHRRELRAPEVDALLEEAYDALADASARCGIPLSTSQSRDPDRGKPLSRELFVSRGRTQLGTLGAGNHFIELLTGPDGDVWVMLHSGSRGVGGAICNNFHRMALAACRDGGHDLPDPGLAWLPTEGGGVWADVGACYVRALRAGLAYAESNRRRMLETVARVVETRFPGAFRWDDLVNIHHNDATFEHHFGRDVWVHRKGAVKASRGTATITPGSMGTGSYLGRGLGNPDAFESCSHGAGRSRSRSRARRELSLRDELALINAAGGKVFAASTDAVLDEMPGAYKDLDDVMANQADLVETVRRFTPLGTYKGVEGSGRRKKTGWRPEEER